MRWLWFIGPLMVLVIYLLATFVHPKREQKRQREFRRWLRDLMSPLPGKASREVAKRLPSSFEDIISRAGGGSPVSTVCLIPKFAYLVCRHADRTTSSSHITLVCRLRKPAPTMVVRPLPIVDGRPVPNKWIHITDDPEFMERFAVEGSDARAVTRWLKAWLRQILMDQPSLWLRAEKKLFALTIYGEDIDADKIDELVGIGDQIFAELGARRELSLFGDEDPPKITQQTPRTYRDDGHSRRSDNRVLEPEPAELKVKLMAGAVDLLLYGGALVVALAVFGKIGWFHPEFMFNSELTEVAEPWQGGWTTKGFGAGVIGELLLLGVLILQAFLAVSRGSSVGKYIFGARIIRTDGRPRTFLSTVVLRTWVLAVIPLAAIAAFTRPLTTRSFLTAIPTWLTLWVTLATVVVAILPALSQDGRFLHDYIARTRIVRVEPWPGLNEPSKMSLMGVGGLMALWTVVNLGVYYLTGGWIWEVEVLDKLGL